MDLNCQIWHFVLQLLDLVVQTTKSSGLEPEPDSNYSTSIRFQNCRIWWFVLDLAVQTTKSCGLEPEPDFNYSTHHSTLYSTSVISKKPYFRLNNGTPSCYAFYGKCAPHNKTRIERHNLYIQKEKSQRQFRVT